MRLGQAQERFEQREQTIGKDGMLVLDKCLPTVTCCAHLLLQRSSYLASPATSTCRKGTIDSSVTVYGEKSLSKRDHLYFAK